MPVPMMYPRWIAVVAFVIGGIVHAVTVAAKVVRRNHE